MSFCDWGHNREKLPKLLTPGRAKSTRSLRNNLQDFIYYVL